MMQCRRRQHLDPDDGAGEDAGDACHQGLRPVKAKAPQRDEAEGEEYGRADQGGNDGCAEHVSQLGRRQVEAHQEEQEDDADMSDVVDELGIGYPGEAVRAEQHTDGHVGHQQGLTREQGHRCQHCRAGKNEKERLDDASFHGTTSQGTRVTRDYCCMVDERRAPAVGHVHRTSNRWGLVEHAGSRLSMRNANLRDANRQGSTSRADSPESGLRLQRRRLVVVRDRLY